MARLPPVPRGNAVLNGLRQLVSFAWDNWFQLIVEVFAKTAGVVGVADLTAQSASVSATNLNAGTLSAGLYRVSYYQSITQAASVSSSLTTVLSWTDGGVAKTFTGAAMTGNTTATFQSAVVPMKVDASTNVTYAVTRASSGSPAMTFAWIAALETVPTS